jgi:site-specific DNA-methyltransferase (adenine-specific)
VKGGGNVSVNMIRDLHSAMEREKAPIGVFITAALPTRPMETEAAAVGRFEDGFGRTYPKLQSSPSPNSSRARSPTSPSSTPPASNAPSGKTRANRTG